MNQTEIYKQRKNKIKAISKDLSKQVAEYKGLTLLALANVLLNMMALGAAFGVSYESLLLFTKWVQSHGGLLIAPNWDNVALSGITILLWFFGRTYIMTLMLNTIGKQYGFRYSQLLKMYVQKIGLIIPSVIIAVIIQGNGNKFNRHFHRHMGRYPLILSVRRNIQTFIYKGTQKHTTFDDI